MLGLRSKAASSFLCNEQADKKIKRKKKDEQKLKDDQKESYN